MSFVDRLLEKRHRFAARRGRDDEAARATQYWASLRTYHKSNDDDPIARNRSQFIADVLVPDLGVSSLLEVGTNTGRNLGIVKQRHPAIRAKGLDVNSRALEHAVVAAVAGAVEEFLRRDRTTAVSRNGSSVARRRG